MRSKHLISPVLGFGVTLLGPLLCAQGTAPTKVGIVNIQQALVSTKDGQKALQEIQTRFTPKKNDLDKQQNSIAGLQDQLNKGGAKLSDEARAKLVRDIDLAKTRLQRDTEDAQTEYDQENQKIMNELGGRILAVINKYAKDNGYALVIDISSQQSPVMYASDNIDITKDIIDLYDKNAPAPSSPAAAKPAPSTPTQMPPARPPATSRPPATVTPKPPGRVK